MPSRANYSSWSSGNRAAIGHPICVQDLENKKVDCSARHLTAVPQDLYPDVHSLDLKLNNFTILRNVSFQFYIQLEDIILGSANVHYIESDTFRPLKNLKSLELWDNPVHFSKDILQWSSELTLLNLLACGLNFFDFGVLDFLPKLEKLDLSFNQIGTISSKTSVKAKMVTELSSSNFTKQKGDNFAEGRFVANITLEYNPLQIVDPDTVAVLRGKKLDLMGYPLSRGTIKNISSGISQSRIKSFSLKKSGIRNITSDMFEPLRNTSLAYLGLSENQLILHPYIFANLRLLFELDLTECGLTSLEPEYFYGMSSLREIHLSDNNLYSLNPNNVTWDINVNELIFVLSYVEEINEVTFKGLHNLSTLQLNYNAEPRSKKFQIDLRNLHYLKVVGDRFESIILKTPQLRYFEIKPWVKMILDYPTNYYFQNSEMIEQLKIVEGALRGYFIDEQLESIKCLHNIRLLDLHANSIYELPSGFFRNVPSLQSLYLNKNRISTIYSDTFAGLSFLTLLNLEGNVITMLSENFLKDVTALKSMDLSSNVLDYLDEGLFADTKVLAILTLSSNRFVGFNQTTFKPIFSSLRSVDISRNVLVCTCESSWIVEIIGDSLVNADRTICSTSTDTLEPLRGKPISTFKPREYCGLNITLISTLASIALIVLGLIIICFYHRWLLKYKFFLLKLAILGYKEIQDNHDREDFGYDINVHVHG